MSKPCMLRRLCLALAVAGPLSMPLAGGTALGAPAPGPGAGPGFLPPDDKILDEMTREIGRFEEAAKGYKGTVQHVMHQQYVEKRKELQGRFEGTIKAEEVE